MKQKHMTKARRERVLAFIEFHAKEIATMNLAEAGKFIETTIGLDPSEQSLLKYLRQCGVEPKLTPKGRPFRRSQEVHAESFRAMSDRISLLNARVSQLEDLLTDPKRKLSLPTTVVDGDKNSDPQYCRSDRDQ